MPTELYGFAIVPLIVGIVEALKRAGLPSRDAPIVSILCGIAAGFAVIYVTTPVPGVHVWVQAVVWGVFYGLSASGLYSGIAKFASTPAKTPTS